MEHFDVIIVGAGLSGIGAARHLQRDCPHKSFAILESRGALGGTWDLFRYPGIRSDSDMFTLGYSFKPWRGRTAIADGPSIREYVREVARENAIEPHIRFHHRVARAEWSSAKAQWTIEVTRQDGDGAEAETIQLSCSFLHMCTGYYRYDRGYTPDFPGRERFKGRVVHPQLWADDIDYAAKNVVVIGSGATAMTLVPAMAQQAAHVTMLQRSPTYVVSMPARDALADVLRRLLPARWAYALVRARNVLVGAFFFMLARKLPAIAKRNLLKGVHKELGPGYDVETHFTPRYNVWDQRVCLVPDGDLFRTMKDGKVSIVTDHIETFTEHGIALRSGAHLPADLIVTATGLELLFGGGAEISVDGRRVEPNRAVNYKGAMLSDVPNMAWTFGYTNASWTLKADLVAQYVCRVLNHMDAVGARQCTPRMKKPVERQPWVDFSSGYIRRGLARFPSQGRRRPWRLYQSYPLDVLMLRFGPVDDGVLEFDNSAEETASSIGALSKPTVES